MAVIKRISTRIGVSHPGGSKIAQELGLICPHCQRQTRLVTVGQRRVCQFCGKDPKDRE